MKPIINFLLFFLSSSFLWASPPLPYSGKISIDGVNYSGDAEFAFSIHDGNGSVHWRNGNNSNETINVFVQNGRYTVLLGGQGMNSLPAKLFLREKLYLEVRFDNGDEKGLRHLGPDQRITSTAFALGAEWAKIALIAEGVKEGTINRSMLAQEVLEDINRTITKSMLGSDVLADLNQSIKTITRSMLPASVRADLNRTITKSMLGSDVLADLNQSIKTITRSMLPASIQADLNRTITSSNIAANTITTAQLSEQVLKYLKPELTQYPQDPGIKYNGQSINLNSNAQGRFLNYQWFKNNQPISGATNRNFQLSVLNGSIHDGNYSLRVSNDFGSVVTSPIQVEVNASRTYHLVSSASNMPMILIKSGSFTMGQAGVATPEHNVTLTHDYYIGQNEVTQAQYRVVMLGNTDGLNTQPSGVYRALKPVVNVSWNDLQVFLSRLNAKEQAAGNLSAGWKYTLPTEAEWEYACRAGSNTSYSWGNSIDSTKANYDTGSGSIVNVGQYPPNSWGLYDMHGNITEHVFDWAGAYSSTSVTNPEGPAFGVNRVKRGGSFSFPAQGIKSATRLYGTPGSRFSNLGFRLAYKFIQPDISNPVIVLAGDLNMSFSKGLSWMDPGYEAYDARDGNISSSVVVSGTVDVNTTGVYTLTYSVSDGASNEANATRTVNVGQASTHNADLNASVQLQMLWVEPGTFTMGSPTSEAGRSTNETEHNVTLTKGFYLGKYEVTQAQYEAVMTGNTNSLSATPSQWPNNPNRPVEKVSWADAQIFLTRLNAQQSANIPAGWAYVLPTESQWEYACRAGTSTTYSWGNDINATRANYSVNGLSQTRDVGYYAANPLGFFDMHGNVWEWTADWYLAAYPTGNPVVDPTGPASGSIRVARGGSWLPTVRSCVLLGASTAPRATASTTLGFRVGFQKQ
jgi:formylglycine-generating enzyme required for sulfatase activity